MKLPPEQLTCELCGSVNAADQITVRAVAWATPHSEPFASIPRCRDSQACRVRCETAGDLWPVEDRTVPTMIPPIDEVPVEPVLEEETPPWM